MLTIIYIMILAYWVMGKEIDSLLKIPSTNGLVLNTN